MIRIISDSACDLPVSDATAHNLEIIPLYITFDGETYQKDYSEIDRDLFYKKMVDEGCFPKTSLPSVDDFLQRFQAAYDAGDSVICLCITTSLSGSFNSAMTACQIFLEDHPDAQLKVFNSWQNTVGQALIVREFLRMREDGLSFDDMCSKIDGFKATSQIIFTISTLDYLKKGGRIGKMLTTVGDKLNIQPLLNLKKGDLSITSITRSRKKAKPVVIANAKKFFENKNIDDYFITVGFGYDPVEAAEFRATVEAELGITCVENLPGEDFPATIGAVTACHTGPFSLGISFVQKYETI